MASTKRQRIVVPPGKRLIFRRTIRDRNGKVRHASEYGIRAFPIFVDA